MRSLRAPSPGAWGILCCPSNAIVVPLDALTTSSTSLARSAAVLIRCLAASVANRSFVSGGTRVAMTHERGVVIIRVRSL